MLNTFSETEDRLALLSGKIESKNREQKKEKPKKSDSHKH